MNINIGEMQRKPSTQTVPAYWTDYKPGKPFTVCKRGYSVRGRAVCSEMLHVRFGGGAGKRTGRLAVGTALGPLPYRGAFWLLWLSGIPAPRRRRAWRVRRVTASFDPCVTQEE
jgi:hypothetical protein